MDKRFAATVKSDLTAFFKEGKTIHSLRKADWKKKLSNVNAFASTRFISNSQRLQIMDLAPLDGKNTKLLWKSAVNTTTISAADFHRACDGKGPTLALAKTSTGKTFGMYSNIKWRSNVKGVQEFEKGNAQSFAFGFQNGLQVFKRKANQVEVF